MSSIIKVNTVQDTDGNNIINENADTITIGASGDTISIPSGATLANNGTATGFGIEWQSTIKTSAFTAVAGEGYFCNTTSSAFTVTLPGSASAGDTIQIVDYAGTFATNNITLTSSLNIEGSTNDKILTTNREGVTITYADATQGWVATSGVNSGDQAIDPITYSADFLVIAGGGSGATSTSAGNSEGGGGGGAGGYRTSTQSLSLGTVYTITVGDGGASFTTGNTIGNNGSNSSISGSGLTTITSTGGGGGGNTGTDGRNGGSGGGGGASPSPFSAGGSGNTPSTSPSQGNDGGAGSDNANTGGGGGAGAVGGTRSGNNSGDGGNGTASSITGSSVTRAGGGGGGQYHTALCGSGGTGGGGDGNGVSTPGGNSGNGTANTGSGGGGNSFGGQLVGAGGKGVVILSVPTASYSGTTSGSPTVTTSGSNTIMQFNGSGSYTG